MIHRISERRLSTSIFFLENRILMPKRKCCEHPIKHANSARVANGTMVVSSQLSKFLVSRYKTIKTRIHWLCPRCHVFESKEMMTQQQAMMSDNEVSSDDDDGGDAMMVEVCDNCGTNDDSHATEESSEEDDDAQMDSGLMNESNENDHDSLDMGENSTDCESMDEEEGGVSYEHEYRKNEAMEQLSAVFELLKIEPIHDKYVGNLLLMF